MPIVHTASGTNVNEIAAGIYRISIPVPPSEMPGGFTFNQFLLRGRGAVALSAPTLTLSAPTLT